jgi:hypothetical protein
MDHPMPERPEIEVVLVNPETPESSTDVLKLYYTPRPIPIAIRHLAAIHRDVRAGLRFTHPESFFNFPNDPRNREWMACELNKMLKIIEDYRPGTVTHVAVSHPSPVLLHELHKYFEIYRGHIERGTEFFNLAPSNVRWALDRLNLLVHRFEDLARSEAHRSAGGEWMPRIMATLSGPRLPLEDEDYQHFTIRPPFGAWLQDYCEVGKYLIEVWLEQDEIVSDDAIRPQAFYNSDGFLNFCPTKTQERADAELKQFYTWWDQNQERLNRLGFRKHDPKNALGYLHLADLNRERGEICGLSNSQIVELVSRYQYLKGVSIVSALERGADISQEVKAVDLSR